MTEQTESSFEADEIEPGYADVAFADSSLKRSPSSKITVRNFIPVGKRRFQVQFNNLNMSIIYEKPITDHLPFRGERRSLMKKFASMFTSPSVSAVSEPSSILSPKDIDDIKDLI